MQPAVELVDVSRLYGNFAALRRVTCSFAVGGMHTLLGENGAGKSTLLRMAAGLVTPTAGVVRVLGGTPAQNRHRIAYMSHAAMLYDELTPMENLRYFARLHCSADACSLCHASPEMALRAVGLDPHLKRSVSQLSQGMRQRASLAAAILADPELLLLDEPFSNMDVNGARELVVLLQDFLTWPLTGNAQGARTVIVTTHQHELVRDVADTTMYLRHGSIVTEDHSPVTGAIEASSAKVEASAA
ncbi:ABC transporter ATP-binding protein [Terriglobus sp.]|uniref:ABC transporter ATP-binding protein n=1 Tax=Terriglobus sp. TaxID=1889013 RepID=UPI003B0027BE